MTTPKFKKNLVKSTVNTASAAFKIPVRMIAAPMLALFLASSLSACSTTTLPWPSLSISKDEADDALTKEEQSLLAELLASSEKNHQKDTINKIEDR